jgi:hypothetical protein
MLVYRLIHFADPLPDIDTGVKRRDRELSKPLLQLFSCNGTQVEVQKQIALMLEMFLDVKRQNKKSSAIEVAYYPIIIDMFSKNRRHVPVGDIWSRIVEGGIPGYYDAERKPKEYQTDEYGTIYRNSFTNIICDKFGAIKKHTDKGSVLIFDIDKLQKLGKSYDLEAKIQLKLVEDGGGPDNPDSSDNIIRSPTIIKENADKEIINNRLNNVETFEANLTSDVNNTTLQNDKVSSTLIKSSELSELSATEGIASLKMYDDGNDKATAVAEAAATTATTIATATIDGPAIAAATTTTNTTIANTAATATTTIYRLGHSDIWACKNCKQKGDKWFMKIHECSGSRNENR